jgi:hypothetical protein
MNRRIMTLRHAIIVAFTCLAGCAESKPVPVYPVAGKVLVNGLPAAGAMVAFHPLDAADLRAPIPVGAAASDGTFRLMTYTRGDGAPVGDYAVTIIWPDGLPHDCSEEGTLAHDRLKGRFADAAARKRTATVIPGHNDVLLAVTGDWSRERP